MNPKYKTPFVNVPVKHSDDKASAICYNDRNNSGGKTDAESFKDLDNDQVGDKNSVELQKIEK